MPPTRYSIAASTACVALYCFVFFINAWLCDDAYITYRSIDNLINGYGPTWNSAERVQSYTHPLWFLTLSIAYFFTGNMYYTALFLSALFSLTAVILLVSQIAYNWKNAVLGIALLCNTKSFIDYSSSGLENPLTHLLIALFFWLYISRPISDRLLFSLASIAGLATLNRMDTVLLFAPALLFISWPQRNLRTVAILASGFIPFALWETFSIIYYGFPVPNTAYAKLGAGIPSDQLLIQGLNYLKNSLHIDPLTLSTIAVFGVWTLWKRPRKTIPIAVGIALYFLYVLRIGGDFMSGRFLAAPLLLAVLTLVSNKPLKNMYLWGALLLSIFTIGLSSPHPPLQSDAHYGIGRSDIVDTYFIADERAAYYRYTGLLNALNTPENSTFPNHGWANWGRRLREFSDGGIPAVVTWPYVGFIGFYAGPQCHLLDIFGLVDPLTARLPMRHEKNWRIGHFHRVLPAGYLETYLYGQNLLEDPNLALYYDKLKTIISGDLFTRERWIEIWRMNTGYYDHLIDYDRYVYPSDEDLSRTNHITMQLPITFKPNRFEYHNGLGDLYYQRQQHRLALQQYKEALKLGHQYIRQHHPEDYEQKLRHLYLQLARPLVMLGEKTSARMVVQTYQQISPDDIINPQEIGIANP